MKNFAIKAGFPAEQRDVAAALYWQAFGAKLDRALGPRERALPFIAGVMRPEYSLSACAEDGMMLGLAGFNVPEGQLVGGGLRDLRATYGLFGASWRAALLTFLERSPSDTELVMDGIVVVEEARGRGIGAALLDGVKEKAGELGKASVRLDVIDSNPRAHALYLREGFCDEKTERLGPLSRAFGFSSATTMRWQA